MATNFQLKPFTFNLSDLTFMRDQINFRPLFDAAGNAIIAWDGVGTVYNNKGVAYANLGSAAANLAAYGTSYDSITAAQGLREVTGLNNNLFLANATWGSVDQPFMQRVHANFDGYVKAHTAGDAGSFYANKTFGTSTVGSQDYTKTQAHPGGSQGTGNVVDYTPRMISQLITTGGAKPLLDANGQVVHWDPVRFLNDPIYAALFNAQTIANNQVALDQLAVTAATSALAAANATLAADTTAASNAASVEAVALALLNAAQANLLAKQGAETTAAATAAAALGAYNADFALNVQPTIDSETAALLARDAEIFPSPEWDALDVIYQVAVQAHADAVLANQPLLDASNAAQAADAAAHADTVAAQVVVDADQIAYNNAVAASDSADAQVIADQAAVTTDTVNLAAANAALAADQADAANAHNVSTAGLITGAAVVADSGILAGGQHDPQDPTNGETFFGAINPGVAPSNSFLAYFGQFFDHGLDFIGKGGGAVPSKITIPLATDDPLYRAPNTNFPGDPGNTKITVSRADISGFDANGNAQWVNHTSPYIDQSQTYGSHEQMTALLREWVTTDGGATYHAGAHLFDGATSAAWVNAYGETTHATLPTLNELRAHLVATGRDDITWEDVLNLRNRDASGDVATGAGAGNSGQALLLDMNPHFDTSHFSAATEAALALQGIVADVNGNYALGGPGSLGTIINFATFEPMASSGSDPLNALAKNVLLESVGDHYLAGDGRVNENIALTTIHHVFHEEHNFQVRNIEEAIQAQDARAVTLGDNTHSIAHDWQLNTGHGVDAAGNYLTATGAISWNESKLFDAAKLTVEMEYQHAAVDQYARTITPDLPEFVGYNSGENATVSLEYAQGAFRFGHSTMRETIDIMDPNGSITGKVMSVALEQAFLNPALFAQKGAAAIAMGMTHQQMNEIDELLTPAMNQGLLGQPLDLAAINIARGRDIGLPTLNDFRAALGLTKYANWADFGNHMVHPESLANFIAAYSFDGDVAKAAAIIAAEGGDTAALESILGVSTDAAIEYAINFLNGDTSIAGADGFNHIDTWIGGLAEVHIMGGLLGETFNLVFLDQINRLMDGDRFYYLYRLNNLNMGDEIANAQLKDIVERNTGLEHLNGSVFAYADQYVDLSAKVDLTHTTGSFKNDHKYGQILEDRALLGQAAIGVYSTSGTSTASNGSIITLGGVQYIRDIRAEGANGNPNVNGTNLDGVPDTGANSNEVLVGTDNKDLLYMGGADDTAYGEGGDDIIYGDAGIDRLYGGDGNDTIYGGDSGDLIDGGAGDDTLWGESSGSAAAGVDQIIGGEGNDIIHGGVGIDKLSGGSGDDIIFGEGDTDAFTHGGDGNDYIDGGMDGDLLWGDGGDDLIVGGNNQDIVAGLDGDDILRPGNPSSAMGGGPDEVLGGDGASDLGNDGKGVGYDLIDFSDYAASPTGVTIDFATQTNPLVAIDGTTPFPAWVGIEGAIGSRNNDTFIGDDLAAITNNWLFGGSGDDKFTGGAGNDVIVGDGIRLDSLIGTYSGTYTHNFDGASHRVFDANSPASQRVIGTNGLLDAVGPGFEKHFTTMLQSDIFKDIELGGSTAGTLNGVAGTSVGDGGTAGTADTVVFAGNRADYSVERIFFNTAHQGTITAFLVTDNVNGRDGTDVVVGVENFQFADGTLTPDSLFNIRPDGTLAFTVVENPTGVGNAQNAVRLSPASSLLDGDNVSASNPTGAVSTGITYSWFNAAGTTPITTTPSNNGAYVDAAGRLVVHTTAGTIITEKAIYTDAHGNVETKNQVWNLIVGTGGNGNQANNTLNGSANSDAMFGLAGNDTLNGNAGDDRLYGGTGNDTLNGGADNDYLDGGSGTNALRGGAGNDLYVVNSNSDTVDERSYVGNTATNNSDAGGVDTVLSSINYTLTSHTATGAASRGSIENLTLVGNASINGTGNALNNTITGNSGNNTLDGGVGADTMIGGTGNDTYVIDNAGDVVTELANAGTDNVLSSSASYTLAANVENLTLTGNGNINGTGNVLNNTMTGNGGNNTLDGGDGNDILNGGNGNDTLNGGIGNDTIVGGQGRDLLTGGTGVDVFDYNNLNEVSVFNFTGASAPNRANAINNTLERITDFVQGADKIDLSGIDARTGGFGNIGDQAFTWLGTGAFTAANQNGGLHYFYDATTNSTVIEASNDGDTTAEFQVVLTGNVALTASDFVL